MKDRAGFDRGFDGHWRRQVRMGLALSPTERLRWLEQTMDELRPLVGRARRARPQNENSSRIADPITPRALDETVDQTSRS
jgi:hypothetical protein